MPLTVEGARHLLRRVEVRALLRPEGRAPKFRLMGRGNTAPVLGMARFRIWNQPLTRTPSPSEGERALTIALWAIPMTA